MISVIVPVYQVEKYVERCIASILAQTYTFFELLLIDDGSKDNSGKICDEYEKRDKRVKVFHKKNGGLSDARNFGLKIAVGKYVTFIDGDDFVSLDYLESLYNEIVNCNSEVVIGNVAKIENNICGKPLLNIDSCNIKNSIELLNMSYIVNNGYVYTIVPGKLFKKTIIDGIFFKKGRYHEDEFFSNDLYKKKIRVSVMHKVIYFYVLNNNGIMSNIKRKETPDSFDAIFERCKILRDSKQSNWYHYYELSFGFLNEFMIRTNNIKQVRNRIIRMLLFRTKLKGIKYKWLLIKLLSSVSKTKVH